DRAPGRLRGRQHAVGLPADHAGRVGVPARGHGTDRRWVVVDRGHRRPGSPAVTALAALAAALAVALVFPAVVPAGPRVRTVGRGAAPVARSHGSGGLRRGVVVVAAGCGAWVVVGGAVGVVA